MVTGIAESIIVTIMGIGFMALNRKLNKYGDMDKKIDSIQNSLSVKVNGIGHKLDDKIDREYCENHRAHQTNINMELIKQYSSISAKLDMILNKYGQ